MLFNLINLPYWLLLGIGVSLYFMVILAGGGDDDADLDAESEVDGPHFDTDGSFDWGQMLGWLGFGRAPLILLLATDLSVWGVSGWMLNVLWYGLNLRLPNHSVGIGILAISLLIALVGGGLLSQPMGKALAAFGEDASSDRLIGCVGTVSSATIPKVAEGRIGQVNVTDAAHNRVNANAQTPDWATLTPGLGDQVLVIDRTGSIYQVLLKDSPDQDVWLNSVRSNSR